MNSTVPRSKPPVIERFIIRAYTFVAAIVVVALMAGGTVAQQTAIGEGSSAATKRLFKAVYDNNLGAVQISIAAGADLTATNELGLMAIDVAVDRGHFEVAHFLLSIRNFRRTKQAETAPPPPLTVTPPAPAAAAPVKQPELATLPPAAVSPTAPWPANKPNPFDAATADPSTNLPLIGPVFGPENAPPPVDAPNSAQAPPPTVERPSKSELAQPGFFNRLTGIFRSGEEEPPKTTVSRPSNAALDTSSRETDPPAETPRSATGNTVDSEDAATESALPVTGAVQETADAPTVPAGGSDTDAAAKDMETAAGGADVMEQPTAGPGFFTRLTGFFKGEEEIPDSSDFVEFQQADEDTIVELAHVDPPETLLPQNQSEGEKTVTSPDIVPAPPPQDGTAEEVSTVAELPELQSNQPSLVQRLSNFFESKVEKPADVTESVPAQPALVPPAESQREVDIASLPRSATVEPAVVETQTETASDVPPAATPSSNPSSEPAINAVQEPIKRKPSRGFFEHLSNLLKPNEAVPPPAVEPTGAKATSVPDQPEASTTIVERPAIDQSPAPSEPALPSRDPLAPAADTTASENNPFSDKARQQVNIPVIGEIYDPGSSSHEPEPSRLVKTGPDSTPPIEVAETPAAPMMESPTRSEEPVSPTETVSLAETEIANESPGILDRLKGFFRPAAEETVETPPAPPTQAETVSAPIEPTPVATESPIAPSEPSPPNLEPPVPAADIPAGESNPFNFKTAPGRVNIPVIGEIYGPGSSLPQPEPSRLVKPAPDPIPPVEVAEEPAPPPETLSLAETEIANESPGILDRLKGIFRPATEGLEKTPPSPPTQTQSTPAPIEPPSSVRQADQSVAEKPADNAPPTTPVETMQTVITPSETVRGATDEPAKPTSLFQRLAKFLKPANDTATTGEITTKEEAAAKKTVETARLPGRPSDNLPIPPPRPRRLEDVVLTLGESVRLGKNQGKGMEQAGRRQPCLKKREGALMFCIGPVDWPDAIKDHFEVSTFMYHGTQAIVRYDEGEATSLYTLFKTESFDAVIAYYTRRFGKPTEVWDRLVKPLAAPQQPNPIMLWRSVDLATQTVSVLEVRKFDDARGGFPDLRRGTVMLRREDAQPIFPRLSTLELMSVN